jgi:hypothetical protein
VRGPPPGLHIFQLVTILEEACHSLIIIEHDPMLHENASEMTEYVSEAIKGAAKEGLNPALLARNRHIP